ncbi:MAG: hypothetical protein M0R17_09260 [Candidatus Omnitrophica bacterium]|jgi:hypothetical protein|nr:hypothetical protein [Candidatus Omnitrophota bacterium]
MKTLTNHIENSEIIGTTGVLVDFLKEKLTQEEWNALCIIHRLGNRLQLGIRFDWSRSIDIRAASSGSQIIDESVFLERECKVCNV